MHIQILGDDDYVSNNFVETFYKILDEKKKFDLLRFKMLKVSAKSEILQEFPQIENLNSTEHLLNDLNQVYWISISENIFSRSVYNQLGIKKYPLAWRSDAMLVFEFGMENIEVSNNAFVAIRRSQIQLTMNISPKVSKFKKIAMSYFYNDLLEKHEARFKKKDRKNLVKKLVYYTSNINSSQKEILRKNLSFFEMIQFYLFKK